MAADPTYQNVVQRRQDGNVYVPSGKFINVESGGGLQINGTDVTNGLNAKAAASTGAASGTVAATGSVQGDAAAIPTGDFVVVTAADGTKGVILPTPTAGQQILVKNNAAAILKVYPATGGAINGLSANAAISMAANTPAIFAASSPTQWFTCPLLPS